MKAYIAEKRGNTFNAPQYGQCAPVASRTGAKANRDLFTSLTATSCFHNQAAFVANQIRHSAAYVQNDAAAAVRIAGIGARDEREIWLMHADTLATTAAFRQC
jgi:hypothetical protein